MNRTVSTGEMRGLNRIRAITKSAAATSALVALGGCVQVQAPERPIEINLNINIRQEVVVALREDAQQLIRQNPGVF